MTGYGTETDRWKSADAGVDLHLTKPADPRALAAFLSWVRTNLNERRRAVAGGEGRVSVVRVLVADAHCCVREGLKVILNGQPDMRVVGETADGPSAVGLVAELDPDVVVVEVALPGLDGAAVARLRQVRPDRKVLVLTACEDAGTLRRLLAAGANGCVLKRATADQLAQAIRMVAGGGTYLDPAVADGRAGDSVGVPTEGEGRNVELSEREAVVVRLIALGYANKQIAGRLRLSVKTIETYKTRAMEKLGMKSRVDIVRYAAKRGWFDGAEPEAPRAAPISPVPSAVPI